MGTAYLFDCPSCGYSAEVCGGTDSGFGVTLRTSVCSDCKAVVDVVIGGPGFFGGEPEELPDNPDVGRCRECNGKNVLAWPESKLCPKCGKRMKKGNLHIMWD